MLRQGAAADARAAGRASVAEHVESGVRGVADELRSKLFSAIRSQLSARHVPNEVFAIAEVPRTLSGKKLEVPVRKILLGYPPQKAANRASVANPAAIDWFVQFAAARQEALARAARQ